MEFCQIIGVGVLVGRIGVAVPFIKVGEAIAIGILIESICIRDWQTISLKPLIWHRWVYLCVLQCRRQTVCADKLFFRDEESRTTAGFPLCWMVELTCGPIELKSFARWRCTFRWRRAALQRDQVVPELNDAPPNQNRGNKKKDHRRDERGTVIVFPNPVHG